MVMDGGISIATPRSLSVEMCSSCFVAENVPKPGMAMLSSEDRVSHSVATSWSLSDAASFAESSVLAANCVLNERESIMTLIGVDYYSPVLFDGVGQKCEYVF